MDPKKVQAMMEWEVPKLVKDIQVFLGFANYYRSFIYRYSNITTPLTDLLRGDGGPFLWIDAA
jgi:hypothetical protein